MKFIAGILCISLISVAGIVGTEYGHWPYGVAAAIGMLFLMMLISTMTAWAGDK